MDVLPSETVVHTFGFLPLFDLALASSSCKFWRKACNWILWKRIYERYFGRISSRRSSKVKDYKAEFERRFSAFNAPARGSHRLLGRLMRTSSPVTVQHYTLQLLDHSTPNQLEEVEAVVLRRAVRYRQSFVVRELLEIGANPQNVFISSERGGGQAFLHEDRGQLEEIVQYFKRFHPQTDFDIKSLRSIKETLFKRSRLGSGQTLNDRLSRLLASPRVNWRKIDFVGFDELSHGKSIKSVFYLEPRHGRSPLVGVRFDTESHVEMFNLEKRSIWYREHWIKDSDCGYFNEMIFSSSGLFSWTTLHDLKKKKARNGFLNSSQTNQRFKPRNVFHLKDDAIEFMSINPNAPPLLITFSEYLIDNNSPIIFTTILRGKYVFLVTRAFLACFELQNQ